MTACTVPAQDCTDATSDGNSCIADPVDLTTGRLTQTVTDLDLGGGLAFTRHYSSTLHLDNLPATQLGPLGRKWAHSLDWRLKRPASTWGDLLWIQRPLRTTAFFIRRAGTTTWKTSQAAGGTVDLAPDGMVVFTDDDGTRVTFDDENQLTEIARPGEGPIAVTHTASSTTFAQDGKSLTVTRYVAPDPNAGRIAQISGGGETVSYAYDSSSNQQLWTVTGPDPTTASPSDTITWTHTYEVSPSGGYLKKVERTAGGSTEPVAEWTYDGNRRVSRVVEPALPIPVRLEYTTASGNTKLTTVTDDASLPLASYTHRDGRLLETSGDGAPGIDPPFASATVDSYPNPSNPAEPILGSKWQTQVDRNGNVTRYEAYVRNGAPGRVIEGWEDTDSSGDFSTGDGYARLRETDWHPTLLRPIETREESALAAGLTRVTTFDYDAPTELLGQVAAEGSTLGADGLVTGFTDVTDYGYDSEGRLTSIAGPRPERYTQIDYDPTSGSRSAIRRFLDGPSSGFLEWTFSDFDARGNPQTVTDPNGRATQFTYDTLGRVLTATPPYPGPGSSTTSFSYDVDGNLTRVDFPDDSAGNDVFLHMGYDVKRNLLFLADSQGNAIVYEYEAGRATREARYTGFVDYASRGTLVGDAAFSYTAAGRLLRAFNPLFTDDSVFSEFDHDPGGNPESIIDENGREDVLVYDALHQLAEIQQVRSATTFTTAFAYDPRSNVIAVTDAAGKTTDLVHDDRGHLVKTVSPDTGTTLFRYDAGGNLTQRIEDFGGAAQRTTSYSYDGLDRLTAIDLPNDPDWVFSYDSSAADNQKGRLASVTNGPVTTQLTYTARGEVATERTTVGGVSYTLGFGYDAAGNRTLMSSADAVTVKTDYAGLRPSQITLGPGSSQPHVRDVAWHPFGPRTQAKFPPYDTGSGQNTVVSTRTMNLRGQVERILVTSAAGPILDRTYTYHFDDGAGPGPNDRGPNLDRVVDAGDPSENRFYFYDELDRLAKATELDGTALFEYAYDAVGNRTSLLSPAGTTSYSYEASSNRLDDASGAEARDYAHDAYGSRIYDGTAPYQGTPSLLYDDANRLVEVRDPANGFATLASYRYDAFGRRVQKTTATQTFVYLYDPEGKLVQEVEEKPGAADHARLYVYLEDELVGLVDSVVEVGTTSVWPLVRLRGLDPSGMGWVLLVVLTGGGVLLLTIRRSPATATALTSVSLVIFTCAGTPRPPPLISWVHTDPLGTPLAVTNNAAMPGDAEAIWRASYEPFGKATVDEDPDGDLALVSLNVRFPGQYEDLETGWHYNFYRTYDPSTGRYLEADPLGVNAGVNLYLYANARPTVAIDPTGLAELGVREFDTGPNRRFGLKPPLTWPPYAQHCFLRFNYDNSDTLSFDPSGVHADPFPEAATFTPIGGPRDNDQCLRDQMRRCKPFDYDFFLFNCCNCASNAIYYCGLGLQGDWPNWPLDASEPPYWSTGPTPVELWLEMFMK